MIIFTFIIKPIDPVYARILVVAAKEEEILGEFNFVGE